MSFRINLITVREKRTSIPFLKSIGAPENNIITTGDDAIEIAYSGAVTDWEQRSASICE